MRFESYRASWRGDVVRLWNQVFASFPNFQPLDRFAWKARIETPDFEPRYLRLAIVEDRVVGFAHGGLWGGEFLQLLMPEVSTPVVGFLAMIGVDPEYRRQGVARSLVQDLRAELASAGADFLAGAELPFSADGRMFNPFYGNSQAPVAPLWGTTEGAAVPTSEVAALGFFDELGFSEVGEAVSMVRQLSDSPEEAAPATSAYEIVVDQDYLPVLGDRTGRTFGTPNSSRTWVAVDDMCQRAALIAYPLSVPRGSWGIFSLEVEQEARGQGIASLLLDRLCADLAQEGAASVETLTVPAESPDAHHLYEKFGFVPTQRWKIFG